MGYTTASLSQWNTGRNIPNSESIISLAKALNVSPEWLMGENVPMERPPIRLISPEVLPDEDVVTFPIIGEVAAGYDHPPLESWEGATVSLPKEFLKGRPSSDFFALKVVGDSMYPAYMDGDIVLSLKQSTLNRSGEVGVVLYDSDYASLKKVEYVYGEDWMKEVMAHGGETPVAKTPDEMARMILTMCTSVSDFMYGKVVEVDGGAGFSFQEKPWSYTI